ncbi:MAG TPA: Na+/H+ antiporter [Bacteroidales bacterium]|nr:Na+/H+ antiporter [Bacteroidales bacterium]
MQGYFFDYIYLILFILGLVMIADRLRVAYPVVLVIGGLILSFLKRFSGLSIEPEMVFYIFLPPLLYQASWQVSWKEFWRWRRVIFSFAFPIVLITATVVAVFSHLVIPGFTIALGFLLGGIVSPPDAVSATTVMRQVGSPRRLISITEGESLLNDASSLIIFRFALAAILTGQFHFQQALLDFVLIVVLGILTGISVGLLIIGIHRWLPVTPSIQIVLTLVTPYIMYFIAEYFHFSGVLAVVSGGLLLSNKRQTLLTYQSRLQSVNVWTNIVFVLNGLVFLLIGLQLPSIINELGDISLKSAILYGLSISFVLIITRLACTLGASPFTRFMSRFIRVADPNPGWRAPLVYGWAGMRGVVSLAAALSIPVMISDNQSFPYRNLILFITFIVILVTLVLQGLTLPLVIRRVKPEIDDFTPDKDQELKLQRIIAESSVGFLEKKYEEDLKTNSHLNVLYKRLKTDHEYLGRDLVISEETDGDLIKVFGMIYLDLLEHQRQIINKLNLDSSYDEEIIRKYASMTDLEEFYVREKYLSSH